MFESIKNFAVAQWHDVKGNAKFRLLEWVCGGVSATGGTIKASQNSMNFNILSLILILVGLSLLARAAYEQFGPKITLCCRIFSQSMIEVIIDNRSKDEARIKRLSLRGLDQRGKVCGEVGSVFDARIDNDYFMSPTIRCSPTDLDNTDLPKYSPLVSTFTFSKADLLQIGASALEAVAIMGDGKEIRSKRYGMGDLSVFCERSPFSPPKRLS